MASPVRDSALLANLARTKEDFSLPTELRVQVQSIAITRTALVSPLRRVPAAARPSNLSTGRIDPPGHLLRLAELHGQNQYLEFGKKPYAPGENGGIRGHVVYASTRPFDDPALLLQLSWNLWFRMSRSTFTGGCAADGVTPILTKVDTTTTSSWDDWRRASGPMASEYELSGQSDSDPFYDVTLLDQPNLLNPGTPLPYHSQYKCYDGMHNWNQLEPARTTECTVPEHNRHGSDYRRTTGTNCSSA